MEGLSIRPRSVDHADPVDQTDTVDRSNALRVEISDLKRDKKGLKEFLAGQIHALNHYGVGEEVLGEEDYDPPVGTYAVVVRDAALEMIGGCRLHTRACGRPLPIESETSPIADVFKGKIAGIQQACEIRGVWRNPWFAKQLIGYMCVSIATAHAYRCGMANVFSLPHYKSYASVFRPLGYRIDDGFEPIDYPDPRYRTVLVKLDAGIYSA
jgi:hypothetical protein